MEKGTRLSKMIVTKHSFSLQTWAPFMCQIYVNGHEFLARKLKQRNISFEQVDNCFTHLQDPQAAQRLADRFPKLPWPKILNKYAHQVNPLLRRELKDLGGHTGSATRPSMPPTCCSSANTPWPGCFCDC
jgi:hypothetical protein